MFDAVSTSSLPMVATRSRLTKSPVLAGRSTVTRVPKRVRRFSSSFSTSSGVTVTGSTSSFSESYLGRVKSGRTSTSTVNCRSPVKSFSFGHWVTSASGRPSARSFSVSAASR